MAVERNKKKQREGDRGGEEEGQTVIRLDTVLEKIFYVDWLKYFKFLFTPAAGVVQEKPRETQGTRMVFLQNPRI